MIAIDTSAIVAIALDEPERDIFFEAVFGDTDPIIAAPTAFEVRLVMTARRAASRNEVELLLSRLRIVPWEAEHVLIAHQAFLRYGKGRGHPAQLNFGDCMSYALAKAERVPLLYKGGNFALTDIRAAA